MGVHYWPYVNSPVQKKIVKCKSYGYPIGPPVPKKIVKCKSYGVPTVLASMSYNVPTCQFHPPKPLNVNHEFWHLMFVRPVRPGYITLHSCGIYNSDIG